MARPALLSDVGGDYSDWDVDTKGNWDIDISEYCCDYVPVDDDDCSESKVPEFPEHLKYLLEMPCRDDDDDDDNDYYYDEKTDTGDNFIAFLLHDQYRWEPIGSYLTRQYYLYSAPSHYKRDHPDDDLFLKQLGDAQVPWRSQLKYPKHADEPLIKDVVALIIWQDTKDDDFWEKLREMSQDDDSLYFDIIRGAASLVYFLYTQANLFKIGHERTLDKQMDNLFTWWCQQRSMLGRPSIDVACTLLMSMSIPATRDEFSFVTENDVADMFCYYADDIPTRTFNRPPTNKVILPPTDKDQLFEDITKVVRKAELSQAQLTADEYTHWMMTLLREEVSQVELRLIARAMGDHPMVIRLARSSEDKLFMGLLGLLEPLLVKAKKRIKHELFNVLQPLFTLCNFHEYNVNVCTEISETIQVADLRRMSLGSRFIGRSHLIWAFYKLGYALPLEYRNTLIDLSDPDEDHPPYHIYVLALKLALQSGENRMQLDHFIYAVLHSKYINFREPSWSYLDFEVFQKALESMEAEVEPKSTVTVRPCGSLDIFSDSSNDSQERTTDFEPSSSENSSTDTGGAEESII